MKILCAYIKTFVSSLFIARVKNSEYFSTKLIVFIYVIFLQHNIMNFITSYDNLLLIYRRLKTYISCKL